MMENTNCYSTASIWWSCSIWSSWQIWFVVLFLFSVLISHTVCICVTPLQICNQAKWICVTSIHFGHQISTWTMRIDESANKVYKICAIKNIKIELPRVQTISITMSVKMKIGFTTEIVCSQLPCWNLISILIVRN